MNMKIAALIPARLESTRLPRKALRDICGKPLIQHVYERTAKSEVIEQVYVSTPDREIIDVVNGFGGKSVMTSPQPTVLDCCSDATKQLEQLKYTHVVVVQGDEPLVRSEMIDLALRPFPGTALVTCLIKEIGDDADPWNPNIVKVIKDTNNYIIYLSRSVIPGITPEKYKKDKIKFYKQVCIMGFSIQQLLNFGNTRRGPLEKSEGIDLVRYPENGMFFVSAIESSFDTYAIDTSEDLEKVREIIKNENLGSS